MKNLYYRPTPKFNSEYRRSPQKKSPSNINFYILSVLGIFLLFSFFSGSDDTEKVVSNDNNLAISKIDGNIRVLDSKNNPVDDLEVPFNLKDGYSILTSSDSSAVISLSSNLNFRLAPSSKFILNTSDEVLDFNLDSGQVWVSNSFSPLDSPSISINTNYLTVDSNLASFNLKSSLPESVSVMSGNLLVSINDDTTGTVLDQIKLDLGKQLTMDNESYQSFKNRQVASVISTLQSSLIKSAWYKWNVSQDSQNLYQPFSDFNTDFALAAIDSDDSEIDPLENLEDDVAKESVQLDPDIQPVLLTPDLSEVQTGDRIILEGTVPPNTAQVMVISFDESEPVPYILKEFKPESGQFKYYASYDPTRGNLVVGENKFEIVAIFADGTESPKTILEFEYAIEKPEEVKAPVTPEVPIQNEQPSTLPSESTSSEVVTSQDLGISSINGLSFTNNYNLTSNRGFLQGFVSKDVVEVYVNDFKLTRFTPNSGSFHYIMSPSFNTLKSGDNNVKIYGKYADGSKTQTINVNIIYTP